MGGARTVIDRHIKAFNDRTPDREPWSSDAVLVAPGGTFTGRDAVIGFLSVFQQAFSDGTLSIDAAIVDGDNGSVQGTFRGVHDGTLHSPAGPVAATGRPIEFRWSATYLVDGPELRSEHLYFDQLDILAQLDLLPQ